MNQRMQKLPNLQLQRILDLCYKAENDYIEVGEILSVYQDLHEVCVRKRLEIILIAKAMEFYGYNISCNLSLDCVMDKSESDHLDRFFCLQSSLADFFFNALETMDWTLDFDDFMFIDPSELGEKEKFFSEHPLVDETMLSGILNLNDMVGVSDVTIVSMVMPESMQKKVSALTLEDQETWSKEQMNNLAILKCFYDDSHEYLYNEEGICIGCKFFLVNSESGVEYDITGLEFDLSKILDIMLEQADMLELECAVDK